MLNDVAVEFCGLSCPPDVRWAQQSAGAGAGSAADEGSGLAAYLEECLQACAEAHVIAFNLFALVRRDDCRAARRPSCPPRALAQEGWHIAEATGAEPVVLSPYPMQHVASERDLRTMQRKFPGVWKALECGANSGQTSLQDVQVTTRTPPDAGRRRLLAATTQHWMWPLFDDARWAKWRMRRCGIGAMLSSPAHASQAWTGAGPLRRPCHAGATPQRNWWAVEATSTLPSPVRVQRHAHASPRSGAAARRLRGSRRCDG